MDALFSAAVSSRSATRGIGSQGYHSSSDELLSGLEVRAVSLTALPVELVTELLRMRRAWGGDSFLSTGPGALG